jgi:phage tail-like protein
MYGEFKIFSLNKESDWKRGWHENCQLLEDGISLKDSDRYAVSHIIRQEDMNIFSEIADFTVGRNGQLFVLDKQSNIWVYDYNNQHSELLVKAAKDPFSSDTRICFCQDMLFLADPYKEPGISAFSLLERDYIWTCSKCDDIEILPLAIVAAPDNYLLVLTPLDIVDEKNRNPIIPANSRLGIIKMDLSGRILDLKKNEELRIREEKKFSDLRDSFEFCVSMADSFYVMDLDNRILMGFSQNSLLRFQYSFDLSNSISGLAIDSNENIIVGGDYQGAGLNLDYNRTIFRISAIDKTLDEVPGYHGRIDKICVDSRNLIYIWDKENLLITILDIKKRILELEYYGLPQGVYLSTSLDSTSEEMKWHKISMEASIPEDTQIKLSYFSSEKKAFSINGKKTDLDTFIKDNSLSLQEKMEFLQPFWSRPIVNASDALLHNASGRYLWLKIELIGTEEKSPLLRRLRIYYPRMSFLSYLPAVYQEDKESADFLERFLSLFGTFYLEMEEKIANIAWIFDSEAVNGTFLKWLAAWLAIEADESWTEEELREIIRKAPGLYKCRGTRQCIEELFEIFTGEKPMIVEYFQYKKLMEQAEIRELMLKLYGDDPYCFSVMVKQEHVNDRKRRILLEKILNEEKPAFTEAKLVILQPWTYMDRHTYLGINTYLSELSLLRLDQKSSIPYNSVLADPSKDSLPGERY